MKIGATTFAYRYSFRDPANSPTLPDIVRQTSEAGIGRLQVCENVRPLEISKADWQEVRRCADALGLDLQLGCKTLRPEIVERYLQLAQELSCDQLRIVMEEDSEHATRENVVRLFEAVIPRLAATGIRLAVENHFDIASSLLVELASAYPAEMVGFCVDTANSLRSFEPVEQVLDLLNGRAYCYHLKDYRVVGSMIGFSVVGAPLGEGDLDLEGCLRRILQENPQCPLYIETWVPSENNRSADVAREKDWLLRSVKNLRVRLESRAAH